MNTYSSYNIIDIVADGTVIGRITDNSSSVTVDSNVYDSIPDINIELGKQSGAIGGESSYLTAKETVPSFAFMGSSFPFNSIRVTIRQVQTTDAGSTTIYLFKGRVYESSRNSKEQTVKVELKDEKYYMEKVAGIPCVETCISKYGDFSCQKTVLSYARVVTGVSGLDVTLDTALPTDRAFAFPYGYLVMNGTSIPIRAFIDEYTLQLEVSAPTELIGRQIRVDEGCDGRLNTCRLHNNESRFMGLGYAMVDYNPLYEQP